MKWAANSLKAAFLKEKLLCLGRCRKERDPGNSADDPHKTHRAQTPALTLHAAAAHARKRMLSSKAGFSSV